ncbi:MAG: ATP-binding protein [Elainellaceae cyanobacterium]
MTHGDLGADTQNMQGFERDRSFDGALHIDVERSHLPSSSNGSTHDEPEAAEEGTTLDWSAIALRLSASLNTQDILNAVVETALNGLNADRVVLYCIEAPALEWNDNASHARIAAEAIALTIPSRLDEEVLFLPSLSDVLPLVQPSATLVADDPVCQVLSLSDVASTLAQEWSRYGVQSTIAIPLVCGRFWVGALVVQQCHQTRLWTGGDRRLLRQIVLHAQTMLGHAATHWQTQQLTTSLMREVRKNTDQINIAIEFESALKRITDSVRDSLNEEEILQTAVRELTELLGLGGCNAALYNLQQGTSTICYEYTNFIPASRGRVAQMNDFPEIYNQLKQGIHFQFCSLIPNPKRGRVALLACPVFVDSERDPENPHQVLGDLWLVHHKDYIFKDLEVRLVQQVANQCAIAIRQARLYQAVQSQVQELERLNSLKDEFLSTVSHELRTPISNVKMAIHMLRCSTDEAKQKRYLDILETESQREADLINDLLDLQKLESANVPVHVQTMALQSWLPKLIEPFDSRFISRNQQFIMSCSQQVSQLSTDFDILQRILSELLNNACKYTATEHAIKLHVMPLQESIDHGPQPVDAPEVGVTFKVLNQVEIPQAELPHLFDKFYRVPHSDLWNQGGTGLGLALVQKLVHQIGGTIGVESSQGWTTFTISVPQHNPSEP